MKLLIIHNKYQSVKVGGEDIVYQNELIHLKKHLGEHNVFSYDISNDDIHKFKLLFSILFSKKHYNNVKKLVEQNRINIVHVHNFFPLLTPSVFKAAKDAGAIVVHTLHNYRLWCISGILYRNDFGSCEACIKNRFSFAGILNKCYRNSLLQSFVAQSAFWFYRMTKVFDNIDYFFVLTNFQKEKVKEIGINETKIILKPNSLSMIARNYSEKKGYLFVGRLEEAKGIFALLSVWKELDEKYVLTIIGNSELEKELRETYQCKNIIFKGKCSREETLTAICESKYLIQPSLLLETFGLTIIEAFSCATPVIGFDIGTREDFIQDGINGFICDVKSLKKTVEKSFIFEDYEILSKNAFEKSKDFDCDKITKKQIEIYKSILEN